VARRGYLLSVIASTTAKLKLCILNPERDMNEELVYEKKNQKAKGEKKKKGKQKVHFIFKSMPMLIYNNIYNVLANGCGKTSKKRESHHIKYFSPAQNSSGMQKKKEKKKEKR
jgi:hypothetical protein